MAIEALYHLRNELAEAALSSANDLLAVISINIYYLRCAYLIFTAI